MHGQFASYMLLFKFQDARVEVLNIHMYQIKESMKIRHILRTLCQPLKLQVKDQGVVDPNGGVH